MKVPAAVGPAGSMTVPPQQLIVSRVVRELEGIARVALGQGLPQMVRPHLAGSVEVVDPSANGDRPDVCVVEAAAVSPSGGLILSHPDDAALLNADRCLVATLHCGADGEPRLVSELARAADCDGCVTQVVTELGVIEISEVGFELRELAPGVASDDVRARVRGSLHVSDAISGMLL